MKRGSIWWVDLRPYSSGHIQGGIRPAIILGNGKALKYGTTIMVIPVTSHIKRLDMKTHVQGFNTHLKKPCMALCEQIISVDRESVLCPMPYITFSMKLIDDAIKGAIGFEI